MSKAHTQTPEGSALESTDVYHDGDEVAVRAKSTHSRTAHIPKTDDDGDVVFVDGDDHEVVVDETHPNAQPIPACGCPSNDPDAQDFMIARLESVTSRKACSFCTETNEDPAKGAGKASFARRMRYGDDWGSDT